MIQIFYAVGQSVVVRQGLAVAVGSAAVGVVVVAGVCWAFAELLAVAGTDQKLKKEGKELTTDVWRVNVCRHQTTVCHTKLGICTVFWAKILKEETHLLAKFISNAEKEGMLLYEKQCINQPPITIKTKNKILTLIPG
jgi:hypothetical protein